MRERNVVVAEHASVGGSVGVMVTPPPLVETKFAQPRMRSGIDGD